MIGTYTKAIAAAVVAAGTAAVTALQDGVVQPIEWATIAGAFLVALGAVWAIPNVPESVRIYGKAITSGLVSLVGGIGTAYLDSVITPDEWVTVGIAFITGLGLVAIAPNARESDDPPQPGGDPVDEFEDYNPDDLPSDRPEDLVEEQPGK